MPYSSSRRRRRSHDRSRVIKRHHYSHRDDYSRDRCRIRDDRRRHQRRHRRRRSRSPSSSSSSTPSGDTSHDDELGKIRTKAGDVINNRYEIIGIAGEGTFGTVFDCLDRKYSTRVAVKAVRSVDRYLEAAEVEIDILATLRDKDPKCKSLCVRLLNSFSARHQGQIHIFIVFEALGTNLYEFMKINNHWGFHLHIVRDMAKQLLNAMQFCHSLGLTHTDLKPENILLCSDEYTVVPSLDYDLRVPTSTAIRLIDFGGATFAGNKHSSIINTRQYRAPEVMLGLPWDSPSDMWSIGCILAELLTGRLLFDTHADVEHIALMQKVLGKKVPQQMADQALAPFRRKDRPAKPRDTKHLRSRDRSSSECRADKFLRVKDGCVRWPEGAENSTSLRYVEDYKTLEQIVTDQLLCDLIRELLHFDPHCRLTASEALKHPFFHTHRDSTQLSPMPPSSHT